MVTKFKSVLVYVQEGFSAIKIKNILCIIHLHFTHELMCYCRRDVQYTRYTNSWQTATKYRGFCVQRFYFTLTTS